MCLAQRIERWTVVLLFRAPAGVIDRRTLRVYEACQAGLVKTIQLRRYTLVDGEYDAFLAWFHEWMPRVRSAAGFAIEFAYGVRETNEFMWAVSAEGDVDAFVELEKVYVASDARAEAFAGQPQRVEVYNIRFIDDIAVG